MARSTAASVLVLLLCSPLLAETISGTVYLDPPALAVRADFIPAPANVKLYRDGGSAPLAETATANGRYEFSGLAAGMYWVAVDSKSLGKQAVWAEQTFGPAGAVCAQTDGTTRTNFFEGTCVGGRSLASDDASSLPTSEHVARVQSGTSNVDFAFSFNIVTSVADAGQGSLRQFVANANALPGPNAMRFVPLTRAVAAKENASLGLPPRWWTIALQSALPPLSDAGTAIDGEAHNILSTASVVDVNSGRIDEEPYLRKGERQDLPREEKPELELVAAGDEGIVCDAACTIRSLAIHGAPNALVTRADATIEQVVIGTHADLEDAPKRGNVGLQVEKGKATLRFLYVMGQDTAGIAVAASGARVDGDYVQVLRCGTPTSGAGIALLSDGSTFRHSHVSANDGAGIIIGSPDGKQPASVTVIEDSVISNNLAGIVLAPGSARNTIARNQITWNRIGGVVAAPYAGNPPQENRITSNIFDENGGRPIALNAEEKRDILAQASGTCERIDTVANHGIGAPVITSVQRAGDAKSVTVNGRACPSQTVELYRSYVTSEIRNAKENSRLIRKTANGETITIEQQQLDSYPSIGEFNYMISTVADAGGSFTVTFPIELSERTGRAATSYDVLVTNEQALYGSESDRAYSAIAIDPQGNTSEMSERTRVKIAARR
jgi:Right handed beta helix region